MKEKLFSVFLLLFLCYTIHAQNVGFIGKKPKSDYNENLKFEKLICKGDSIIGFNADYYSVSYNRGHDWQSFEYNQTILPYNNIFHEDIDESLFIRGNDLIIFNSEFLISKDFGRSFKRISKNADFQEKTSFYKGYMFNDNYIGLSHEGLYISKDCNNWKKINTPQGVQVTKFTSSKNEMYIATLKNIYKSVDNGNSWNKIDNIVFKRDVETMRSLGGINKIKAFDNKLYIDYYANYDTYVYDLIRKTETKLENVKSVFIKDNSLFVLTDYKVDESSRKILENGKILCYRDSLENSNIDISKLCETTSPSRSFCGIENFYINSNYIVLDGRISIPNSSSIRDVNLSNIGCISGNCNDGQGTYCFSNGDKFIGSWTNSKKNGNGTYYYSNGDIKKGVWKNGINIKVDYLSENGKISTYLYNDSSNSQNQILLGKYDLELYLHPANKEYKVNIKTYQNVIASGDSFYSLVYSPMSSDIFNQQRPSVGNFFLKTNFSTKETTDIIKKANPQYDSNNANLNIYNLNNNLNELDKIYSLEPRGNSFWGSEMSFDSNENSFSYSDSYTIPNEFELKTKDGSIETFNFRSIKIGNGVCGFLAQSMYDYKTYLFIYNNKTKEKYTKIDISKNPSVLRVNNSKVNGVGTTFIGRKNNQEFKTNLFSVSNIVQNDKYIYVFLGNAGSSIILPIKINKMDSSVQIMSESFLTMNNFRSQEFTNKPVSEDGYFYMPSSKGFLNYYKVYENGFEGYNLDYYNPEFIKTWKSKIKDIVINHVYESGNFIILGGYSKTSGYKGFPNPKIVVINKKTSAITYEKVVAKKNGEVGLISSDANGNIIIAIGSFCCQAYDTDSGFIPQIILDKLNSNGVFENDLFNKQ